MFSKKVGKEKRFSEKEGYFVGWLPDVTIDFQIIKLFTKFNKDAKTELLEIKKFCNFWNVGTDT